MAESGHVMFGSRNKKKIAKLVSSSVFDKLTDELLIEILIRLPLKPTNLCKCISTRFRSLIYGSYFVGCYVKHHKDDKSLALYCQPEPNIPYSIMGTTTASGFSIFESPCHLLSLSDYSNQFRRKTLRCLASDNGLFLCCALRYGRITYFVCNMLTKQWISLPPPPSNVETVHVGFLCNPQYSCDDGSDKTRFKVVQLEVVSGWQLLSSRRLKLEIFCSVSGRWTKEYLKSRFTLEQESFYGWNYWCEYRSAVVCDGLLHWDNLSDCGIFTYNPYNSECRTIKVPHVIRKPVNWDFNHYLRECCGRLRFCNFFRNDRSFQVWELTDYENGAEWLLLHNVRIDDVKPMVQAIDKFCQMPMLFPHPLKQDVVFFQSYRSRKIVEYNMTNKLLQLPSFLQDGEMKQVFSSTMIVPFVLPCWPTATPLIPRVLNC